jgi:hypothetical protein
MTSLHAQFGFTLYDDIAETLRCGGDELAVDAVLIRGKQVENQGVHLNPLGLFLTPFILEARTEYYGTLT